MNKRALVLALMVVLSMNFVFAANSTNTSVSSSQAATTIDLDKIDKAYNCLDGLVKNNSRLSFQEAIFSTLALGSKYNLVSKIDEEKGANCWPKSGCKLKETALAALAYSRAGKSNDDIIKWLGSKNGSASELQWYLEIDITSRAASDCKIRYDGSEKTLKIKDDMTLQGSLGSCLSISNSGYWMRISSSCLEKEFEISCDQDFVSSLIYQKSAGGTVYVSSQANGASSSGTTKEKVQAQCFKTGTACDYEGSLWAAFALKKANKDVAPYLPYLVAFADDYKQTFPSAFLYILNGGEDFYSSIVQSQKQGKFWEVTGSANSKYFDSSLAMLALQGSSAVELENAKNYFASVQGTSGCWNNNNVRDSAFLLYSGWPRSVGGGGGTTASLCTSVSGYSCGTRSDCRDFGGSILTSFDCPNAQEYCCNVKIEKKSCSELLGKVCANGQNCIGSISPSLDGSCCVGTCEIPLPTTNECEDEAQGECKSSCDSTTEEEIIKDCEASGQVCCVAKAPKSSNLWIWIIILSILIILVIIGIIFRDRLRVWWFHFRGRAKSAPITRQSGPGYGMARRPMPMMRPMPGRPMQRPMVRPMPQREASGTDKEMEETFKKLKELSK